MVFYGRKITYRELKDWVDRFATALDGLGVTKGDRVALFLVNCPQFAIAYFGALKLGAILTPISAVSVTPEVKHQLEDSCAETMVCQDILYDFIEKTGVPLKRIIVTGIGEYLPRVKRFLGRSMLKAVYRRMEIPTIPIKEGGNVYRFQALLEKSQPSPPRVEVDPREDLAVISYTAGTTGDSKGAMLTHRNLFAAHLLTSTFWSYSFEKGKNLEEGKETIIASLPFYHIYGQALVLLSGLIRGYTLVVLTNSDADDILKSIVKYRATFLMGVPSLFGLLMDHEKTDRVDWKRVKLLVSSADSLSDGIAKAWERRTGIPIHEGYGLTETGPAVCLNPSGKRVIGSLGIPLPGTRVAIAHPEKATWMPFGEIGELVVAGPQVMKGYWKKEEETARSYVEIMGEKWLRSGDLARIDEDGYFHFYDRKRDVIQYEGASIFAREIEEVIKTHPKVREAAVIGVSDPNGGTNIKAVIALQADARGKLSEEEIVSYCREKLPPMKVPRIIEFRGEIPRTDVGKVSRRELREERET
jgi:long-chain acyl-CoA synthetase